MKRGILGWNHARDVLALSHVIRLDTLFETLIIMSLRSLNETNARFFNCVFEFVSS